MLRVVNNLNNQPIIQDARWQVAASVLGGGQGDVPPGAVARCAEGLQGLGGF